MAPKRAHSGITRGMSTVGLGKANARIRQGDLVPQVVQGWHTAPDLFNDVSISVSNWFGTRGFLARF